MKKGIRNIVFDLGGVLVNLNKEASFQKMEALNVSFFREELTEGPRCEGFLGLYEKGLISDEEFRTGIREKSQQSFLTDEEIDTAWCAMLSEVDFSQFKKVASLQETFQLYVLSNTNPIHINYVKEEVLKQTGINFETLFTHCFYSHDLHLSKPDLEIFEEMIKMGDFVSEETLFIDDALANVKAAQEIGLNALHYQFESDLLKELEKWK